jgi:hypothetical protein
MIDLEVDESVVACPSDAGPHAASEPWFFAGAVLAPDAVDAPAHWECCPCGPDR